MRTWLPGQQRTVIHFPFLQDKLHLYRVYQLYGSNFFHLNLNYYGNLATE